MSTRRNFSGPPLARPALSIVIAIAMPLAVLFAVGPAFAAPPLTVCIAESNPPLSYQVSGEARGLDVRVAQAIAAELGRPLALIPFESKYEADSSLSQEVNALLSSGVCDLASGFPLLADDLGTPARATARVPDYPGAKRPPLRDWVRLGTLAPSQAYHTVALGLLVRESARESATLGSMGDARIGVTAGTLAGTAVTLYRNGRLRAQLVSLSRDQDALAQLDAGLFDATLASLDRYDAWRLTHPGTSVRRAAFLHPLRINVGFVALAERTQTLAAADRVIARALENGDLERWSIATGATWITPVDPQVGHAIGLPDLANETP